MNFFIGDSHIRQFHLDLPGSFTVTWFSGATAKGLTNLDSNLCTGTFVNSVVDIKEVENIFLMFGAVDIDFSFYKKLVKNHSLKFEDFIIDIVDSYVNFISKLNYIEKICIMAPHLSPISDVNFTSITAAHSGVSEDELMLAVEVNGINQLQRNNNTILFNDLLEIKLKKICIDFIRIDKQMISVDGSIDKKFMNSRDHHCNRPSTLQLWRDHLIDRLPVFNNITLFDE